MHLLGSLRPKAWHITSLLRPLKQRWFRFNFCQKKMVQFLFWHCFVWVRFYLNTCFCLRNPRSCFASYFLRVGHPAICTQPSLEKEKQDRPFSLFNFSCAEKFYYVFARKKPPTDERLSLSLSFSLSKNGLFRKKKRTAFNFPLLRPASSKVLIGFLRTSLDPRHHRRVL